MPRNPDKTDCSQGFPEGFEVFASITTRATAGTLSTISAKSSSSRSPLASPSHLADKLDLVDGTLLAALPRMHGAPWINEQNRAAKLHLKFSVLRQAALNADVSWLFHILLDHLVIPHRQSPNRPLLILRSG